MVQRVFARSKRRVGLILVLVVFVGGLLALIPVTVGAAKSSSSPSSTSSTKGVPKPKTVEIVGPGGIPVNVVGGALGIQEIAPPMPTSPLHIQTSSVGTAGSSDNLISGLSPSTTISISSVTVTCSVVSSNNSECAQSGNTGFADVTIFAANGTNCSSPSGTGSETLAEIEVSTSLPSVDFTYPTPRLAPLGFTIGPSWCLGMRVLTNSLIFISVDGSE